MMKDNVIATQFHPEKSGKVGIKLLENFLNLSFKYCIYFFKFSQVFGIGKPFNCFAKSFLDL